MAQAIRLAPAYKDYIWGGGKLNREYHKDSPYEITAESWELSCHPNGPSRVSGGEFDGQTLDEAIQSASARGEDWLGKNAAAFERFPVLIKLIDANDSLSIQVHPDDTYAASEENGSYGKTEVWYIVDAEPGAELIYGFSRDMTQESFRAAVEQNELKPCLNSVPVHAGEVYFVRSGLVHAIGKGILICEIQQNSDTTYRVYDWGRVGADGKPRPLHIDKAVAVSCLSRETKTDFSPALRSDENGVKSYAVADCKYFKVEKREQNAASKLSTNNASFLALTIVRGEGMIASSEGKQAFRQGDSFFLPAVPETYEISGKCEYLITSV